MAEKSQAKFVISGARDRIADTLKKALEGELVELAVAHTFTEEPNHSKTGVSYHSKCGHSHSKATLLMSVEQEVTLPADRAALIDKLANEILRLKG
jgi:hypothetical protein